MFGIHYLLLTVPGGDILFSMVIFKCLSVAKLYIDFSAFGGDNFIVTRLAPWGICRLVMLKGRKAHQVCSKWNSLSQHKTHNELIFPSLPFYSVRGDIDIHTSQQALCQFPSLIQICSERSTNPLSSAGCEDDSPSCLKRKLQKQYTRGSFLILRYVNAQDSFERFHPNEVFSSVSLVFFFSMCAAYFDRKNLCGSTYEHEISACMINTLIHARNIL